MKRIFALSPIVVVLVAIVLVLINNKKTIASKNVIKDRSNLSVSVILQSAMVLPVKEEIQSPATLIASEEATIATTASGRIVSLSIPLGNRVSKGQILGHLDVKETEIKLQAAELQIEKLKNEYQRNKVLAEGNAITSKARDDSKFDLDNKVIEAQQLRKQIANGQILAPISGIIVEKSKESGEHVNTGEVIGKIVNTSALKAKVFLPENKVFKLEAGQPASISTDVFPGKVFTGTVSFISPQGDENHNYLVELTISNDKDIQLKAGMYAMIKFNKSDAINVLQISKSALVEGMKNPYVFVVENNKAIERKITIGREIEGNIEVVNGLQEGERVVVSGQINLVNGSSVNSVDSK